MASYQTPDIATLTFLCIFFQSIITSTSSSSHPHWYNKERHQFSTDWLNHGGDIYNRRYAYNETKISPSTVSQLRLRWKFNAGDYISATPAVYDGTVYFTSWNGYLYAVKEADGSLVWKKNITELTGLSVNQGTLALGRNITIARATPTIAGDDMLIIGITGPAYVVAVKRTTGNLIWSTELDSHPYAVITMSGTYHNGGFYVGVSSIEEATSIEQCCTFIGSFAKLDARTGNILWQTFMLPDNNGSRGQYAGGAIWGSSPSIDASRKHVYVATGNLYSAPQRIQECQERLNSQNRPSNPDECVEPDNHSDSILALDTDSGKIRWYNQLGGYDVWFRACANLSNPDCPTGPNPDADFGEAPMMLSSHINGSKRDIVVAVQKSGYAWALDGEDGNITWFIAAGPGGGSGGGTWGAATDEKRIYTNIANSDRLNFTLVPSNTVTNGGGRVALNSSTGQILWSVADPKNATTNPVTIANGVLFAGSTDSTGPVYALNAKSGKILWSYETGASVFGGMSVSNGCMYVGHGYKPPQYTTGNYLFAFCI